MDAHDLESGDLWDDAQAPAQEFKSEFDGITYNLSLGFGGYAYVTLWLNMGDNTHQTFNHLKEQSAEIETELGDLYLDFAYAGPPFNGAMAVDRGGPTSGYLALVPQYTTMTQVKMLPGLGCTMP